MLLATNFDDRSILQGKIEAIWAISFKIKAKIEVRVHSIACHFADKFVSVGCVGHMLFKCDEMRPQLFTVKTLFY